VQRPLRMNEGDNTDLIQKACRDPEAFAQLYLAHYDGIYRYCARRLFDGHAAEEVTSTVFFKVMHHLGSFDGGETDFRSWLLRIATNAINDYLRDAKRRTELLQKTVISTQAESVPIVECNDELLEKKALLKEALLSLKPKYQTVITLRFFENMKLTEIAACLGKKPSTVRSWLSRATAKLRKTLDATMESRGSKI
ncbi:MAG: sigma-70 family RNA polymerase sigma factor, partial [Sedimentisphaerales bacterium]|nr:sigma-70 family RNA polymerase sigma factor [Sedimentisphaerales bacterium]